MICIICGFEPEMDDIELRLASGRLLCLACFHRDGISQKPMPTALRRELTEALGAMDPGWFQDLKPSSGYYQGGFRPTA